jgi:hypothetical protein
MRIGVNAVKKPGPEEKPAKRSAGKSLMHCPGREAKAEGAADSGKLADDAAAA